MQLTLNSCIEIENAIFKKKHQNFSTAKITQNNKGTAVDIIIPDFMLYYTMLTKIQHDISMKTNMLTNGMELNIQK